MIQESKLSISVDEAEFSKDYQYIISAQFQQQKKQTDISALARNPIFTNNNLIFHLPSSHTLQGFVVFAAQMVLPSEENRELGKQNVRILGECSLDLSPFALQPTETYNLPIRQQLKFTRNKDGKQLTVGRFIASIKIVKEDALPSYVKELQHKKLERNQYFSELPPFDSKFQFQWRMRLQVRQALNIGSTEGLPAQLKVEVGWTEYKESVPQESRLFSTAILPGPHPEWNQTILITNPAHIAEPKGFVMVSLRDENNLQDVFRIYLPLESMGVFVPYNLNLVRDRQDTPSQSQLFISAVLESPLDSRDQLVDVVIQDVTFQPALTPFKQINIGVVMNNDNEPKLNFHKFDPREDSIERVLEFDQAEEFNFSLSATMKVPPIKSGNYKAAAVITMSESLLRKRTNFFLVGKVSKGVYKVAGLAQNIQKDLTSLLVQRTKKKLFLSIRNHPSAKMGNCQLHIIAPEALNQSLVSSRASNVRGEETASQKLMKELNFSNNDSMLKHVAQNNDIIGRILRELDDKSQSLRQAAAEISNLRGRVKLLQNENGILRQQSLRQQDQLVNLVQREVENMSMRDLKEKIVKISQLYKVERVKNRQLDRTVKAMEPQISNTMQLNSIIAAQKNNIQILNDKVQRMLKEHQRISLYKETIRKQEKVIVKLETVMKEGMQEVRNARKVKLDLEQMKKRQGLGTGNVSRSHDRDQIERLQGIISQMQANSKVGSRAGKSQGGGDTNYQLEFKVHQAETRVSSLEQELQQKSRSYARELAMLRMKLAEKEALMDGYRT